MEKKRRRKYVVDSSGERYPFSRGILVKSLMKVGLSVDDAYAVAEEVSRSFRGTITSRKLAERVYSILKERFGKGVAEVYRKFVERKEVFVQEDREKTAIPFSKGILANSIRSAGLETSEAFDIAKEVYDRILSMGKFRVKRREIREIVSSILKEKYGEDVARRYLVWRKARELKKPVIILISGATGVGKSRLAAELTTVLDINRMASTDSIREVMRRMISKEIVPSIHVSSYEAGKYIYRFGSMPERDKVIYGFIDQSEKVLVGVNAVIGRAIKENVSIIVEGIHLIPGAFEKLMRGGKAYMVHIVLTTLDEEIHRGRFKTREKLSQRTSKKYLKNFKAIRLIQDYLYSLAKEKGNPIIENIDFDQTRQRAIKVITDMLIGEVEKT